MQDRLKTNCGRKKTVQVPRNVGIIAQNMRQTPTLSIRRLHLGTGLRRSSVQKMLRKTLKMRRESQVGRLLEAAERDFTFPDYILWTDEAIFHLDGHVNRHNAVIWSVQNPHALIECSNQKKAGVMVCMGWADQRPYHWPLLHQWKCHRASVPSATTAEVWPALQAIMGEEEFVVFQHDGASAHYETRVRAWLESWRIDGWAEGDPYHGQHEVLIYLHWTSGLRVT